jgi:hypothetical protein
MDGFDDVRPLTADLPMVEEGRSYGTPSMKVKAPVTALRMLDGV